MLEKSLTPPTLSETRYYNNYPNFALTDRVQFQQGPVARGLRIQEVKDWLKIAERKIARSEKNKSDSDSDTPDSN